MSPWPRAALAVCIIAAALATSWWLRPTSTAVPKEPAPLPDEPPSTEIPAIAPHEPDAGVRPAGASAPDPLSEALCPDGMGWVGGAYCPAGFQGRLGCRVPELAVGACVDLHEYPNQLGVRPAVMVTFAEAAAACAVEGKRLCRDAEWTFACRGTVAKESCWSARGAPRPDRERLWSERQTALELERVDRRRPSGFSGCVSARGTFDQPGNVAEWVLAGGNGGYEGALKGGHFNDISIGCERTLYSRELATRSPHVGFRCCHDPLVEPPVPAASSF